MYINVECYYFWIYWVKLKLMPPVLTLKTVLAETKCHALPRVALYFESALFFG